MKVIERKRKEVNDINAKLAESNSNINNIDKIIGTLKVYIYLFI